MQGLPNLGTTRRWDRLVVPVLVFGIAAIVLTYPMVGHLGDRVPDTADPLLNSWILAWDAHAFATDPLSLYNANSFYPYSDTLAYSESLLGQALLAAPIIWLTGSPVLALNVCWLLTFILSGLAMYALVYEITHAREAALVAGMIFAFNGFRFAHTAHLQLLSAQWIPLSLFFMLRLLRAQRWTDALGLWVSLNLQVLSCYYYGLFAAVSLGLFLLTTLLVWRPRITRRLLAQLTVLVACTALVQIPLSIPYFRVAASLDFERSLADIVRGGADLTDFLTAPPGNVLLGNATGVLRGEGWWEHVTFPGIVTLILALLAIIRTTSPRERKAVTAWSVLALAGFVLSLGPALKLDDQVLFAPLPYRALFEFVPGFRAIRQPARFHVVTMTGLSVLAGIGMAGLTTRLQQRGHRLVLAAVAIGCIGLETWTVPLNLDPAPLPDEVPPVYDWLAAQPGEGPVLELPILMDVGTTESLRLYYSTFHWKRLINGYGGFYPPTYAYFLFFDREFPHQPYDWIVGLGTRYVVLHRWQVSDAELRAIDAGLEAYRGTLNLIADFGTDQVYEVIHPTTQRPNEPGLTRTLGGSVRLLGYVIDPPIAIEPGSLEVKLFWQCLQPVDRDYTVFVHVLDAGGNLIAQHDGQPANGSRPTTHWRREEVVVDRHIIEIPESLTDSPYTVRAGMYDLQTMQRLPARAHDDMMTQDFLSLGTLYLEREHD